MARLHASSWPRRQRASLPSTANAVPLSLPVSPESEALEKAWQAQRRERCDSEMAELEAEEQRQQDYWHAQRRENGEPEPEPHAAGAARLSPPAFTLSGADSEKTHAFSDVIR